ncbi:probable proteasome inhibitor [Magnolia sinica]|uniref:probable proteasome inhibitor n=1 Tax=Magnolia sinica TaxID=86752 RepID=UPI00265AEE64|nr:probable proteasome inhibitor [Magnolia sinica]
MGTATATATSVMAVIRASRPSFRKPHDKIAFAVHASFLPSGYTLIATGTSVFSHPTTLPSPEQGEVGIDGWNELDDCYGFIYTKTEKGTKISVLVKCLVIGDKLVIDALPLEDDQKEPYNLRIKVKDYVSDEGNSPTNYSKMYKNFPALVEKLQSDLLDKLENNLKSKCSTPSTSRMKFILKPKEQNKLSEAQSKAETKTESKTKTKEKYLEKAILVETRKTNGGFPHIPDYVKSNRGGRVRDILKVVQKHPFYSESYLPSRVMNLSQIYHGIRSFHRRRQLKLSPLPNKSGLLWVATQKGKGLDRSPNQPGVGVFPEDRPDSSGIKYPPVSLPTIIDDLHPGPGAGFYRTRGGSGSGGGMLLGPNDPRWGGIGGEQPGGSLDPGIPPGSRFDPYGPPDVPGFEPIRFVRNPRRPGEGTHPDLEHFGSSGLFSPGLEHFGSSGLFRF